MRALLRDLYLRFMGSVKGFETGIHVVNSHFISPGNLDLVKDTANYDRFLLFLSKSCRFISLEEATLRLLTSDIPEDEVLIAFTFDDGFEECYTVIAPLLEKYNCRGAFFINANYISSEKGYQTEFNNRTHTYTKTPMNWDQIKDLHSRGHLVGSHTLDHVDLSTLPSSDIEYQLNENKKILEEKLKYNCDYFAWTYGRMQNFPYRILETAQKFHPHIYSATNFKQYFSYNGHVINRRHIEAFWPKSHIRYFLSFKKVFKN